MTYESSEPAAIRIQTGGSPIAWRAERASTCLLLTCDALELWKRTNLRLR